jgi:hypothetical protein
MADRKDVNDVRIRALITTHATVINPTTSIWDAVKNLYYHCERITHSSCNPHVRASWTLRGLRSGVLTPGTNRKLTVLGRSR